ncbi:ribosome-associated translation inhibitor RaiA [Candidatus Aerophobetes bacterium]|nr:ribosome-associated translation inhibitor RaiA [Candidatus Aerophobetes bacterium]
MKLDISGVHVEITKDVYDFVNKKIDKVNKYLRNIIGCRVIIKFGKNRYETEINIQAKGSIINAKEDATDLFASIEGAIKKAINQSKKYKEKKSSHKIQLSKNYLGSSQVENLQGESREEVTLKRVRKEVAKPLEIDEAIMQLRSSGEDFLFFLNSKTNQINVICKDKEGSFTLIEPY